MSIKNVAVFGAAGALGAPLLKALIDSAKFNLTVISRSESKSTYPGSVKVVKADYLSLSSLTTALLGQDAMISTVGNEGLLGQSLFIDAAIAAGVKRILPSEFGSDWSNPLAAKLPITAIEHKMATRKHLEEKVASGTDVTYTYVINGAFLDWGLQNCFFFNWSEGKPALYDGGHQKFSACTLEHVGQAVVGVLTHPEETKNRSVYVQDCAISQSQIFELAKKVTPGKTWEPVEVSVKELKEGADEKLAKGDLSMPVMMAYLWISIFDGEYGGLFEKLDNDLLGVPQCTDEDIETILKTLPM